MEIDVNETAARLTTASTASTASKTAFAVLGAISFCHLLNDMMQSLLPAIYPMLKGSYSLSFGQIGVLTLTYQITASLLQPIVGSYTDRKARPYSLAVGMGFTLVGLLLLGYAASYELLLFAAALIGTGSSVFHPESSRVARMASGGQHGLAQSVFQVGGNLGSSVGPLLAAFIVLPHGQSSVSWFSCAALVGIFVLIQIGHWYKRHGAERLAQLAKFKAVVRPARAQRSARATVTADAGSATATPGSTAAAAARTAGQPLEASGRVKGTIGILLVLIFSKYFYLASITSYYTFYLINHFHVSVEASQIYLFVFLGAVALGTIIGGPLGDRFGRKYVIWFSILGVLPFTLTLPHVSLVWTAVLSVPIGMILASAFPAIIVYAQELLPGKTGTISGLFFGFAFGMGGIGAAVLGQLADHTSIELVYQVCAFLPALGMLAAWLPNMEHRPAREPHPAT
ncbi:MAG: MFS transporter [Steroidobacteraceae bacterium]